VDLGVLRTPNPLQPFSPSATADSKEPLLNHK
jgi:hypothetical protein